MTYIFDDNRSIIHFCLGIIASIIPILNIIIVLSFIIYQLFEEEYALYKLGDFIEFIMGFIAGISLKQTLLAILLKIGSFG